MNTFDEFEKSVALVIRDRKQKRCEKDSKLGKGIGLRHSEAFVRSTRCVSYAHSKTTSCKAATLSQGKTVSMKEKCRVRHGKQEKTLFFSVVAHGYHFANKEGGLKRLKT